MNRSPIAAFPRTPRLDATDSEALREEIRAYFHATFDRYESLFQLLDGDEAYYRKPIALRHPLIFYLGHTATFFVNKFILAGLTGQRINPKFESMFAVGVDEMSWDDLNDAHYDWPTPAAVRAYRDQVRAMVDDVIASTPLSTPIGWDNPFWPVLMGIEHERIHLETSSVLIRQHALHYVRPHPDWAPWRESGAAPANVAVDVAAGSVTLGRPFDDPYYGWDNEYGTHTAEVPAFKAAKYLVSNGEFRAFVDAGGYTDDRLWDEEGLGWRKFAGARCPSFWVADGDTWKLRLLAEEVAMPWDWPVETNCHEARAYCRWLAHKTGQPVRLPSEDEWQRLHAVASATRDGGAPLADTVAANLHLDHPASACPVTRHAHGDFFDVVGNVWQWCETPTYPFAGFAVHSLYDDFTTPTFDDRHNIIKGGSWISCGNEARHVSRYAFRRHFFQHAGFRWIIAEHPARQVASVYETDALLAQYSEFHYGDTYYGVANFPKALADLAIAALGDQPARRALDLGCATGRASFELARHFEQVTGIDFSARFIQAGVKLAAEGVLRYTLPDEGELVSYRERRLADLGLDTVRDRVEFFQGDACNLKDSFTGYDLILAANLIDRLYSPRKFLASVHQRLNPGGLLVIASPYTWLEEYTRREEWVGGFKKDGESWTTLDGLKALLEEHFDRVGAAQDVPFVIRETRRKFQHSLSEVSIWRLRTGGQQAQQQQ